MRNYPALLAETTNFFPLVSQRFRSRGFSSRGGCTVFDSLDLGLGVFGRYLHWDHQKTRMSENFQIQRVITNREHVKGEPPVCGAIELSSRILWLLIPSGN